MLMKVFGDLKAGRTAPHDQNGAWRQFAGIAYALECSCRMSFGTSELNGGMTPFSRCPVAITTLLASMAPVLVRSK